MSTTVKKYEIALVVDVDGVGEEILSLPIIAKLVDIHWIPLFLVLARHPRGTTALRMLFM